MAKRVRLKELAEELGLSRTAVSRALNDSLNLGEGDHLLANHETVSW